MDEPAPSAAQIARDIGTTPATLRRWLARGLVPQHVGRRTAAAGRIAVERFVADVGHTLPDDARIVKTIGDEVMVVPATPPRSSTGPSAFRRCTRRAPAARRDAPR